MSAIGGVGGVRERIDRARAVIALPRGEDWIGVRVDRHRRVLAAVDADVRPGNGR